MLFIAYSAYLLLLILNRTTQPESGCEVASCFIFGCLHSRPQGPRFRHAQKRRALGSKNGLSRIVMCMRHSVPKIEMKDDLNFLAIVLSDKQISCMANIDYRLFKCLDGKVVNKSRRTRFIRDLRELQKNRTTYSLSLHVIFKRSRRSSLLSS